MVLLACAYEYVMTRLPPQNFAETLGQVQTLQFHSFIDLIVSYVILHDGNALLNAARTIDKAVLTEAAVSSLCNLSPRIPSGVSHSLKDASSSVAEKKLLTNVAEQTISWFFGLGLHA
jgi:hypothetical protein